MRILRMLTLPVLTEYHYSLTQYGAEISVWFNWSSNEVRNLVRLSPCTMPCRGVITKSSNGCLRTLDLTFGRRIFKARLHLKLLQNAIRREL
ncbi:hypothetical protein AUI51_03060 [archaeon 13_1_40CM_2_52_4]|nr:MAG: hypothetical protein AUI51_03060 [archaeon 13_1_40CM_2_52_4]